MVATCSEGIKRNGINGKNYERNWEQGGDEGVSETDKGGEV